MLTFELGLLGPHVCASVRSSLELILLWLAAWEVGIAPSSSLVHQCSYGYRPLTCFLESSVLTSSAPAPPLRITHCIKKYCVLFPLTHWSPCFMYTFIFITQQSNSSDTHLDPWGLPQANPTAAQILVLIDLKDIVDLQSETFKNIKIGKARKLQRIRLHVDKRIEKSSWLRGNSDGL